MPAIMSAKIASTVSKTIVGRTAERTAAKAAAAVDPLSHLTFRDIAVATTSPETISARFTYLKDTKVRTMMAWHDPIDSTLDGATAGGGIDLQKLSRISTVADAIASEAQRISTVTTQVATNMSNSDVVQNLIKLVGDLRKRVAAG